MANLNRVMLIGRLTRDPEVRTFANGGKVAKIGFAVNNRKKNQQTGQWEDEAVWIDAEAFNRETGRKLADLVEQYLRKGTQVYLEGHLRLDQWTDKEGQKRSKLVVVVDSLEFLDSRQDGAGMGEGGGARPARMNGPAPAAARRPEPSGGFRDEPDYDAPARDAGPEEDIPF